MKFKLYHYPQVPCEPFTVEVDSIEKAMLLEKVLAEQHCFLFDQNIIPDYCNVITVQIWNEDEDDWWDYDDEGNDWDALQEFYFEKQPKFKDLRFETEQDFDDWLRFTHLVRIELFGEQDLTTIYIAESGEILHTNLQSSIWCGKFADVDLSKHEEKNYLKIFNNDLMKWETTNLEIEEIIPNTK
jgi:Superinfection exclusion gene product 17